MNATLTRWIDKSVLYSLNRRVPATLAAHAEAPTLEGVLAQTRVDEKTAVYPLTAPGEHAVWLDTPHGPLRCRARVRPHANPAAPLLLYHHGLNEYPYTASWRRIVADRQRIPMHHVCVQAPYHDSWLAPLAQGFASLGSVYQMIAGSLRVMALVQDAFEAQGAAHTVLVGVSWGGMTSMLYQGLYGRARAVIPMLTSPDIAQVIWDTARLFDRPVDVPLETIKQHLDFSHYYRACDPARLFPLLGDQDLFFRLENHADVYAAHEPAVVHRGHITGLWQPAPLRKHVLTVLHHIME
ncbi:MAG: hypothetical protein KC425_00015 [Anaerolineales bacterium]|nr:hypothetical protein [Anaerolineales bacterium]